AGMRVTSRPKRWIEPLLGAIVPESRLKSVLLPLPFGPMMPTISAGSTLKVTPAPALMPPKERRRSLTSSALMAGLRAGRPGDAAAPCARASGRARQERDRPAHRGGKG